MNSEKSIKSANSSRIVIVTHLVTSLLLSAFLGACAVNSNPPTAPDIASAEAQGRFGVLIMAHGGNAKWNAEVEQQAMSLQDKYPVTVAFGMADAKSIQEGFDRLHSQQVNQVGVVRLFVSGESWRERTAQILGLLPGAPPRPAPGASSGHEHRTGMSMAFWQIDSEAHISMSQQGLSEAIEMDDILLARMQELSENPAAEDVLIIAHGTSDDAENQAWESRIAQRLAKARDHLPFHDIRVFTLREDWPEKRALAEEQIRHYVASSTAEERQVLVIPFRVQGFGPYSSVLENLPYRANGIGLVPHRNVSLWIENQARLLKEELETTAR